MSSNNIVMKDGTDHPDGYGIHEDSDGRIVLEARGRGFDVQVRLLGDFLEFHLEEEKGYTKRIHHTSFTIHRKAFNKFLNKIPSVEK